MPELADVLCKTLAQELGMNRTCSCIQGTINFDAPNEDQLPGKHSHSGLWDLKSGQHARATTEPEGFPYERKRPG